MKAKYTAGLTAVLILASAIAAAAAETESLDSEVRDTVQRFQQSSPKIQRLFNDSYGYAVFPSVGKGAIGIGGAEGRGQVFDKGALVGTAKLIQGTIGVQLGGQSYSEVVFFETEKALNQFKNGKTAISAALSGAAAADGVGAEAKYQQGVLVYTMQRSGLMFEASIGGQHFSFTPMSESNPPATVTPAPPSTSTTTPAAPSTPPSQAPPVAPSTPTE